MFARVSRFAEPVQDMDEAVRLSEEKIVPQLQPVPGFLGLQFLVDPANGQSLAITYWETEETLRASEGAANRIREESNELTGSQTVAVERYEVAMRVGL